MRESLLQKIEGYKTCGIFCNLSEACDTIDHRMLLWKLDTFLELEAYPLTSC